MEDEPAVLVAARDAYRRREWAAARKGFVAARDSVGLSAEDLGMLADAAWWLGLVYESTAVGEASYRGHLGDGQVRAAAWAAIGIAVNHFLRGAEAVGAGWIGQAARLLADEPECPEQGYLRYLVEVEAALDGPDPDAVIAVAREIRELGRRLGDPNLVAAGALGEGRVQLRQGRVSEGSALLDEAMATVLSGDLAPEWSGNLYCHMIAACYEMIDIRRARQWTEATERWLATLPAAVLFTGICRVHRSQLLALGGAWEQSRRVAAQVCADLADIDCSGAAEAHYQVGEICRLRSEPAEAEQAYQRAHELGRDRNPASRCCAWPNARSTRPPPRSGRRCSRRIDTGSPGPGSARPRSRSRSPAPTSRPPARPPTSWTTSPRPGQRPASRRWPDRPAARHCWPRGTPRRRYRRCARRAGSGTSSTPPTTPRGSGCCSPSPTGSWPTPTRPRGS